MPRDFSRTNRVAEQIKRETAILLRELKDPRVGMVTVNAVEVSRDMGHAKLFVTSLTEGDRDELVEALNHAAGFLRRELGRIMTVRSVPQLHFFYDESVERGARMSLLIDEARASDHDQDDT